MSDTKVRDTPQPFAAGRPSTDRPRTDALTKELVGRGCDITYPALQYAKLAETLEREVEHYRNECDRLTRLAQRWEERASE